MAGDPVTQDRRPPVYVGPESLQTGQSLFGRDREVMDLTDLVIAERLVLLYAPSGAGKTSLIQAGLVPALRAEGFDVPAVGGEPGPTAPAVILRVDESAPAGDRDVNRYVRSVLSALERHRPAADRRPADALAGQTLAGYADAEFPDARLDRPEGTEFRPVVLIFDQFEEVLTLDPTDVETKEAFFRAVGDLLNDPGRSAVFAIRQDYLADLRRYFDFLPTRLVARFQLDPLLPRPARDAIVEPAAAAGVTFEAADELIEELRQVYVQQPDGQLEKRKGPFVEPVHLQVVCRGLWDRRADPERITVADVHRLAEGGLSGVDRELARYYAAGVAAAAERTGVPERRIRDWFDRALLTQDGRRIKVRAGDEQRYGVTSATVRALEAKYLIRTVTEGMTRSLELSHDRMGAPVRWDNNRWRDVSLSRFQRAAAAYAELPEERRSPEMLVGGELLAEGEKEARDNRLDPVELKFLAESRKRVAERAAALRNKLVAGGVGMLIGLSAVAAVAYYYQVQLRDREVRAAQSMAQVNLKDAFQAAAQQDARKADRRRLEILRLAARAQKAGTWEWEPDPDDWHLPPSTYLQVGAALANLEGARRQKLASPEAETALRATVQRLGWRGLVGFIKPVRVVAFSPDGRYLAVGWEDRLAVWDLTGPGRPGRPTWHEDGIDPTALAFTPDGGELLVGKGTETGTLAFGRPSGRRWLFDPVPGLRHEGVIREIHVSSPLKAAGPNWVVTVGADGTGFLWRRGTRQLIPLERAGGDVTARVTAVGFTPVPKKLYVGTTDGRVVAWDLRDDPPKEKTQAQTTVAVAVAALAVHPKGEFLAVAPYRSGINLWGMTGDKNDIDRKNPTGKPAVLTRLPTDRLTFHPDGRWLAAELTDGGVRLFARDETGAGPAYQPDDWGFRFGPQDLGPVSATAFDRGLGDQAGPPPVPSPLFLAGTPDRAVRVYDLDTRGAAPFTLPGPQAAITALAFSPDRSLAVAGCQDGTVHLWDIPRALGLAEAEPRVLHGPQSKVVEAAVSPDGRRLAVFDQTGRLSVWDLTAHRARPKFVLIPGPSNRPRLILDDRRLTVLFPGPPFPGGPRAPRRLGRVFRWDLTGDEARPVAPGSIVPNFDPPTGASLVDPGRRWSLWIRDVQDQEATLMVRPLSSEGDDQPYSIPAPGGKPPADRSAYRLAMSADGRVVAAIGRGRLAVWKFDPTTGKVSAPAAIPVQSGTGVHQTLAVSPTGSHVAAGTDGGVIRIWEWSADGRAGGAVPRTGHRGEITALVFTADGRRFVSGGADTTVRIWDLRAEAGRGNPVILTGHTGAVTNLLETRGPDGPRLISTGADGTVRLWTLDQAALVNRVRQLLRSADRD